jgi:hypothetical protein
MLIFCAFQNRQINFQRPPHEADFFFVGGEDSLTENSGKALAAVQDRQLSGCVVESPPPPLTQPVFSEKTGKISVTYSPQWCLVLPI